MSARAVDLNLLPKEVWEKGIIGRLLKWILSVGRYVVVFTELIVISAFLYRFGLDKTLLDLRSSIKDKRATITAFGDLEPNFRLTQIKLKTVKTVSSEPWVLTALNSLSQMLPADAVLTNVTINNQQVAIEGRVGSQIGLATLLNQSQSQNKFSDVVLENVKSTGDESGGIDFRMTLTRKQT